MSSSPAPLNSSKPSRMEGIRTLVAPQKMDTSPTAAANSAGRPSSGPITQPKVAPTKKLGTTSPPLNPQARVSAVRKILHRKSHGSACPCSTAAVMTLMPAPL